MKGIKDNSNGFGSLIRIISNNKYTFYQMSCLIPTPSKLQQDFEIPCSISTENTINYDSVELPPYYSPFTDKTPFEIIINGDMTDSPKQLFIMYGPNEDSEYDSMYFYQILE